MDNIWKNNTGEGGKEIKIKKGIKDRRKEIIVCVVSSGSSTNTCVIKSL
jgi:hypothetical protein